MGLLSKFRQEQTDAANAAINRHDRIFTQYLDHVDAAPRRERSDRRITILARSPASPVVQAFINRTDELTLRNIATRIIVARLDPEDDLHDMAAALATLVGDDDLDAVLRWASNSCILDAHEQLILGSDMCWSGDAMRREPGKRDSLDLFECDAPQTVRLGELAFDAIWSTAEQVPSARLGSGACTKPVAAAAMRAGGELAKPALLFGGDRPAFTRH